MAGAAGRHLFECRSNFQMNKTAGVGNAHQQNDRFNNTVTEIMQETAITREKVLPTGSPIQSISNPFMLTKINRKSNLNVVREKCCVSGMDLENRSKNNDCINLDRMRFLKLLKLIIISAAMILQMDFKLGSVQLPASPSESCRSERNNNLNARPQFFFAQAKPNFDGMSSRISQQDFCDASSKDFRRVLETVKFKKDPHDILQGKGQFLTKEDYKQDLAR